MRSQSLLFCAGFFLFSLFSFFSINLAAYELVVIQTVSASGKNFVVRLGYQDGIEKGTVATFSSPNYGLLARVQTITGRFSVWEVLEEKGKVPFTPNEVVSYNRGRESFWMIDPSIDITSNAIRERMIAEELKGKKLQHYDQGPRKHSVGIRSAAIKNIHQTVSLTDSHNMSAREIGIMEFYYFRTIQPQFTLGLGYRQEKEVTDSPTITTNSTRSYFLCDFQFNVLPLEFTDKKFTFLALTLGLGNSSTEIAEETVEGKAYIFPGFRAGIEWELPFKFSLVTEVGMEYIIISEHFEDGDVQDTTLVNGRLGLGLKRYF